MNLEELGLFVTLATTLHFGKAARQSHVGPSTLSRAIQRLEEQAGKPLFERDRRHVALTREGEIFLDYARETLQGWATTQKRLVTEAERLRGELKLFASVTATYSILPDILDPFNQRHPEVTVQIVTGDANVASERILDGTVDAAIAPLSDRVHRGLRAREVARTPLVMIGPRKPGPVREALAQPRIDWESVPMIAPQSGLMRSHFNAWFRARGIRPRIYGHVSGHEGMLSLVCLGLGAAIIPHVVLEKSLFAADVQVLRVRPALPEIPIGFCAKRSTLSFPIVKAFWEMLPE